MSKNSIVFFGSGPVASRSLQLLAKSFVVEAVITKPSTVKEMKNVVNNTPIYDVHSKQSLNELIASGVIKSRLAVLIDFGIIISQEVIDYFPLGIVNSHFSVLPEWRGADPISFAILSGQHTTGVSLMLLTAGMDEGPLLDYKEIELKGDESTPELTQSLIQLSDQLLKHKLPIHLKTPLKGIQQETTGKRISYSRKLTKQDGILDYNKSAVDLEREIRAFIEWPKSQTTLGGRDIIVTGAYVTPDQPKDLAPGHVIISDQRKKLGIVTSNGTLWISNLKPAGKKEMTAAAFLAGYRHLLN